MEEASRLLRRFKHIIGDDLFSAVDLKQPATLMVVSLSGVITVLAIYLAWYYTRSKQTESPSASPSAGSDSEPQAHGQTQQQQPESEMTELRCPFSGQSFDSLGQGTEDTKWPCDDSTGDSTRPTPEGWEDNTNVDPKEYCDHIQSQYKQSKHRIAVKEIEQDLSPEQQASEKDIQREQLQAIFKLMEDQREKFGVTDMTDMADQMKLYKM